MITDYQLADCFVIDSGPLMFQWTTYFVIDDFFLAPTAGIVDYTVPASRLDYTIPN